MKIELLRIGALVSAAGLMMTGCLSDDTASSSDNSSSNGFYEEKYPDDNEVSHGVFSVLNLDYPCLL